MMPTDTQITNGSCPMRISNREFKASPLSDKDDSELSEYVQFCMLDLARKYSKNIFPDERREFIQAAISASFGVKWNSSEGSKILSTPEGGARIGWQMIQNNHNMSFNDFKVICLDKEMIKENLEEIDRIFVKLNTIQEVNGKEEVKEEVKNP